MKYPAAILLTAVLAVSGTASTAFAHDRNGDRHGDRHGDRDHRERERVTLVVRDQRPRHRHHEYRHPHRHKARRHHWRHWKRRHDHPIYRPRYRHYEYRPIVRVPRLRGEHWGLQLFYFD